MWRVAIAMIVVSGFVVGGCEYTSDPSPSSDPWERDWYMVDWGPPGATERAPFDARGQRPEVNFSRYVDQELRGADGCHGFAGVYTFDDPYLTLTSVAFEPYESDSQGVWACVGDIVEPSEAFQQAMTDRIEVTEMSLAMNGNEDSMVWWWEAGGIEFRFLPSYPG